MNTDDLLAGVMGPAPEDPRFAASLTATLKAARGRRYRRQAARGAAVLAVAALAVVAVWREMTLQPTAERLAGIAAPTAMKAPRPVFTWVESSPLPTAFLLETRADSVVAFSTQPGASVEWINDDQLLALAPGCLALTRSARGLEFIALCDDLIGSP